MVVCCRSAAGRGAMYPWESAFTGVEVCPPDLPMGLREQVGGARCLDQEMASLCPYPGLRGRIWWS